MTFKLLVRSGVRATVIMFNCVATIGFFGFLLFGRNTFSLQTTPPEKTYTTQAQENAVDRTRLEWVIKVPSDFNYRAGDKGRILVERSALDIFGHVDATGAFTFSHRGPTRMILTLSSDLGGPAPTGVEQCLTEAPWIPPCGFTDETCKIYMTFQGWPVYLTVPRETLYREPHTVCGLARGVLSKWTRSIEDRRPAWSASQSPVKKTG